MRRISLLIFVALYVVSCTTDELPNPIDHQLQKRLEAIAPDGNLDYFILPSSEDLGKIPAGVGNPLTPEKIALGKMLFFETGLAKDAMKSSGEGTYSCASCHLPTAGFMPGRIQGIADGGIGYGLNGESRSIMNDYEENELDAQGARALSLLNVAFVTNTTWSGKFGAHHANENTEYAWDEENGNEVNHLGLDGLEAQNIEGTQLHRMRITAGWLDTLGYTDMYNAAFPDFPEHERYTHLTTSFAISAYLRTLMADQAPFQRWLQGESDAMSQEEKAGAMVFFTKGGCYRCHKGAGLSSVEFHAVGVRDLYQTGGFNTGPDDKRNFGRGGFTRKQEDMYKFKVPQLYNMKNSPFYFHGSSHHSLHSVVDYFNDGIPENEVVPEENISKYFHPLNLTEEEKEQLVKFLEKGLYDPYLERYVPEEVLSGNCFPNNDPLSRVHLGCD